VRSMFLVRCDEPRAQVMPAPIAVLARLDAQPERGEVALESIVGVLGCDRRHVAGGHVASTPDEAQQLTFDAESWRRLVASRPKMRMDFFSSVATKVASRSGDWPPTVRNAPDEKPANFPA
jgi:hypothetical protein